MKTVKRVYSAKTPYHSAEQFNIEAPAEQLCNETKCKTAKHPSVKDADAFGEMLWKGVGQAVTC